MGAIKPKINPLNYIPSYQVAFTAMDKNNFMHFNRILNLPNNVPYIVGVKCKDIPDSDNITVSDKIIMPLINMFHLKSCDLFFGYLFTIVPANLFVMDSYFLVQNNMSFVRKEIYKFTAVNYQSNYLTVMSSENMATLVSLNTNNIYPRAMLYGEKKEK
jgi:hypothetical protein